MRRFLMWSVFDSNNLSHAVELSVALGESERWERIRHVAVKRSLGLTQEVSSRSVPFWIAPRLFRRQQLWLWAFFCSHCEFTLWSFISVFWFNWFWPLRVFWMRLQHWWNGLHLQSKFEVEFVNIYVNCLCVPDHIYPRFCVDHRVADIVDNHWRDVWIGTVLIRVVEIYLSSVPLSFCVGWTCNGGSSACFKCLWCRCKIRGSGVPEDVWSHIVVKTCEMMKVVASATCSLESSKNRRFESLFHGPTFTHDMIRYVSFSLWFSFTHISSCLARTHRRAVAFCKAGSSRMLRREMRVVDDIGVAEFLHEYDLTFESLFEDFVGCCLSQFLIICTQ